MKNSNQFKDINEVVDGIEENIFDDIHNTDIDEAFEGLHPPNLPWSEWQSLNQAQRDYVREFYPKETSDLPD